MFTECECSASPPRPNMWASQALEQSVRILLGISIVFLAFHGARLGNALYRSAKRIWPAPAANSLASRSDNCAPPLDEEEQQRLAQAVNRAMEARRLDRARSATRVMVNVFPAFLLMHVALYGSYLWIDFSFAEARDVWRQAYPAVALGTITSTIWHAIPSLLSPRSLNIVHALFYVFFFAAGTLGKDNEFEFVYSATWIICARIMFGVLFGNSNLVSVMNLALCAANVIFLYMYLDTDLFVFHLIREMWGTASIVVLCKLVESSLLAEVRSAVEARNSSEAESTVHSLLSAMCDAVIHVGQDLRIQRPSPRLALLLLMQNTLKHLKGNLITDLMAEPDRIRFRQVAEDTETPTRSLNVHLRDEYGGLLGVRVFVARCPVNESREPSQLIGISVDDEAGVNNLPERHSRFSDPLMLHDIISPNPTSLAARSRRTSLSSGSDESLPLHSAAEDEVAVWFDPEDPQWMVLSCTVGFTVVCGPASTGGFSLLKAVANKEAFTLWFQRIYNAKLNQDEDEGEQEFNGELMEPLDLILLPQSSIQKSIGLRGTCVFSELIDEGDRLNVKLNFQNLSEVSRPRKDRESKRRRVRDASEDELPRPPSRCSTPMSSTTINL